MHLYYCLVKTGHAGAGKYGERTLTIKASSALEALVKAKRWVGVKKGKSLAYATSVLRVEMVS